VPVDGEQPPVSAAAGWSALRPFVAWEQRAGSWAERRNLTAFLHEFVRFGAKQAWACLFGGIMLALLLGTHRWYPHDARLARYDFLTIAAFLVQAGMLVLGLETREEAGVIILFHVAGTVMEIFKTSVGSWIYPEPSLLRMGGVPLFTGFMYASVGSYIARAWRVFDFRFTRHPPLSAMMALAAAIYVNFFTHHFVPDMRLALFAISAMLLSRTWIYYRIHRLHRRMPLLLGLVLVTSFIWIAENIGTFARAWVYPHQARSWSPVSTSKIGAWYLLMLISYTLVALVNRPKEMRLVVASRIPAAPLHSPPA
jgi:uncharacterized membrane protein YoaT (DUF817 family)